MSLLLNNGLLSKTATEIQFLQSVAMPVMGSVSSGTSYNEFTVTFDDALIQGFGTAVIIFAKLIELDVSLTACTINSNAQEVLYTFSEVNCRYDLYEWPDGYFPFDSHVIIRAGGVNRIMTGAHKSFTFTTNCNFKSVAVVGYEFKNARHGSLLDYTPPNSTVTGMTMSTMPLSTLKGGYIMTAAASYGNLEAAYPPNVGPPNPYINNFSPLFNEYSVGATDSAGLIMGWRYQNDDSTFTPSASWNNGYTDVMGINFDILPESTWEFEYRQGFAMNSVVNPNPIAQTNQFGFTFERPLLGGTGNTVIVILSVISQPYLGTVLSGITCISGDTGIFTSIANVFYPPYNAYIILSGDPSYNTPKGQKSFTFSFVGDNWTSLSAVGYEFTKAQIGNLFNLGPIWDGVYTSNLSTGAISATTVGGYILTAMSMYGTVNSANGLPVQVPPHKVMTPNDLHFRGTHDSDPGNAYIQSKAYRQINTTPINPFGSWQSQFQDGIGINLDIIPL